MKKRYRLSFDDNIFVFRDLARDLPVSIFENRYLALLYKLHTDFGAKLHLNIYYRTEGFCLADMPDCYKAEWKRNAEWLQLSFHALADDPPYPYQNAGYEEVMKDCLLVQSEILRFAGEASLSNAATLHYCIASEEGCHALYDAGVHSLVGLFDAGLSYHLDSKLLDYLHKNMYYTDSQTGINFFTNDLVLNNLSSEAIVPMLEAKKEQSFLELMIHEQYFHPFYPDYQPDFSNKLCLALEWVTANGYEPAFLEYIVTNPCIPLSTDTKERHGY